MHLSILKRECRSDINTATVALRLYFHFLASVAPFQRANGNPIVGSYVPTINKRVLCTKIREKVPVRALESRLLIK
jgi:hypothetical protein